jgi:hypothetical protein
MAVTAGATEIRPFTVDIPKAATMLALADMRSLRGSGRFSR